MSTRELVDTIFGADAGQLKMGLTGRLRFARRCTHDLLGRLGPRRATKFAWSVRDFMRDLSDDQIEHLARDMRHAKQPNEKRTWRAGP